jgi:sugar/nucleoside kinase (ribokinase family)
MRAVGRRARLLTIGDLMLDVVVRAEAGIEEGTDVPGTIRFRVGGSAANTARAFAALGGAATFVGAVAADDLGRRMVAAMRSEGVHVHPVIRRGVTPRLLAVVAPSGERSFVTDRGVADDLPRSALSASWLRTTDVLHLPAYSLLRAPLSDTAIDAAREVRQKGGLVSVDLASRRPILDAGPEFVADALRRTAPDVLFCNRDEARALLGSGVRLRRLLDLAPTVAVKEGAAGCRVLWRVGDDATVNEMHVATRSIRAADTTGAGDAFDAGFLHAFVSGGARSGEAPPPAVLRRAALAGHRAASAVIRSPRAELLL